MKKLMMVVVSALLIFAMTACTINLGNGYQLNDEGIRRSSSNAEISDVNSAENSDISGIIDNSVSQVQGDSSYIVADSSTPIYVDSSKQSGYISNEPYSSDNEKTDSTGQIRTSSSTSKTTSSSSKTSSTKSSSSTSKTTSSSSSSSQSASASKSQSTTPVPSGALTLSSYGGASETAYAIWDDSNITNAKAYYKLSSSSSYTEVDNQLIHTENGKARVDFVGLKAGVYDLKVISSANKQAEVKGVTVAAYDRSGYAHFNYTKGVGAYNDDGTLKSGIKVVYITEATKNSAGLVKSVQGGNVCVRIVGKISCPQYLSKNKFDTSITDLSGITRTNMGDDSYWNMIDVKEKSNITVEGIGTDAEFYQFGFTFKKCNSVEVRNVTFTDYPEDACSFEGDTSKPTTYGNYWVHNCKFNVGKNGWDLTSEQDKGEGDGATDLKGVHNVTFSYIHYEGCHKTGLVGGSDSHLTCNVTMHHNYYQKCNSRTPLGRQANIHMYNNYFESAGSYCVSLRANAYLFSEANYVKSCATFRDSKTGGACKSFNDVFSSTSKGSISVVTDRTAKVSNSCTYGTTFDTDASKFYYDASAKKTKVSYLTSAEQAMNDCKSFAGVLKANQF